MPDIKGTTRAQTIFLRAFRTPAGPPAQAWPSPAILRKWLRKNTFRRALQTVQETLRFQADFHLANAATQAAQRLSADSLSNQDLNRLLRLSHIRQRFTIPAAPPPPSEAPAESQEPEEPEFDEDGRWIFPDERAIRKIKEEALASASFPPSPTTPISPSPSPKTPITTTSSTTPQPSSGT